MKRILSLILMLALVFSTSGCGTNPVPEVEDSTLAINLNAMTLNGEPISADSTAAVYAGHAAARSFRLRLLAVRAGAGDHRCEFAAPF